MSARRLTKEEYAAVQAGFDIVDPKTGSRIKIDLDGYRKWLAAGAKKEDQPSDIHVKPVTPEDRKAVDDLIDPVNKKPMTFLEWGARWSKESAIYSYGTLSSTEDRARVKRLYEYHYGKWSQSNDKIGGLTIFQREAYVAARLDPLRYASDMAQLDSQSTDITSKGYKFYYALYFSQAQALRVGLAKEEEDMLAEIHKKTDPKKPDPKPPKSNRGCCYGGIADSVYQWVVEPITSVIFGDGSSWYQLFTYFIPATLIL